MRILTLMILGLMVLGCGKSLTEEELAGTYERTYGGDTTKFVLKEDGFIETWNVDGKLEGEESKWNVVNGELHHIDNDGFTAVFRINEDRSITRIAVLSREGERKEQYLEALQITYKKIK